MNLAKLTASKPYIFAHSFIDNVGKHNLFTLAGALAFNTALSITPLILIFLMMLGFLGAATQARLIGEVENLVGQDAASAIRVVVDHAGQKPTLSSIAGISGVVVLLISASSVFAQLQFSLNVIWETDASKSEGMWFWLRKRLISMAMVLVVGITVAGSLVLSSLLAFFFSKTGTLWHVLDIALSVFVFSLLFGFVFSYLPDIKLSFSKSLGGGFLTAVLFSIGKLLIGLYIGKSAFSSLYGAAGSLVVLLVWVYYSSFILFAGAELTRLIVGQNERLATVD